MEKKIRYNANYINYLLNLFDGKMRIDDILTLPMSLLVQLQKIKEIELEGRAKEIKNIQMRQNLDNKQMTVNNKGKRYVDKTGK